MRRKHGLFYSHAEEVINTFSHAAGVLLVLTFGLYLFGLSCAYPSWRYPTSMLLYVWGAGASFVCSAAYHALRHHSRFKPRLRQWDHAAIYWHIAGSYSPITLIALQSYPTYAWGLFVFVWVCALVGTRVSFRQMEEHSHLETACFLAMGLSVLVFVRPFYQAVSFPVFLWVVLEGGCYVGGTLFYSIHRLRYMHSVFHIFVLAGSFCHMMALYHLLR